MKQPYSLFPRTLGKGKKVFYYWYYDDAGRRRKASTGKSTKTAALHEVQKRIDAGKLGESRGVPTFGEYATNWWIPGECPYMQARRGSISRAHAETQRSYLVHHILPYFKAWRLDAIRPLEVEKWINELQETALSASSINHCLVTFKKMMNEAERLELVTRNPARHVMRIPEQRKPRTLLSITEARDLFDGFEKYWNGHLYHYTINLVAASTGMRLGEILGLFADNVFDTHIHVCQAWSRKDGLKDTKTGDIRDVPLPAKTSAYLSRIIGFSRGRFIFSLEGEVPYSNKAVNQFFHQALENLGIPYATQQKRGLTFHAWRHWFNSALRSRHIPDSKLRLVLGHRTPAMTERYTSFRIEDYEDIHEVQKEIFK